MMVAVTVILVFVAIIMFGNSVSVPAPTEKSQDSK